MNKKHTYIVIVSISAIFILLLVLTPLVITAQESEQLQPNALVSTVGTAFTYQGTLTDGGLPANGTYDLRFYLWPDESKTTLLGTYPSVSTVPVEVTDGAFSIGIDFGGGVFNGEERWLEIEVNGTLLSPLQPLTPTPYAIYAQSAPWNGLSGVPVGFADGEDNDTTSFWSITGNSGTNPATNFLGTVDNVAMEIRVNNQRAFRFEPNDTSPNLVGGYSGNMVTPGVYGATISGGGSTTGGENLVTDSYGTVCGGCENQAGNGIGTVNDAESATVGGGVANTSTGPGSTISGGIGNKASGVYSMVGGGWVNTASGDDSMVGGGHANTASAVDAVVGGGYDNTASGGGSTIGGGYENTASATFSTVGGGNVNTAMGNDSTVGGGSGNDASGLVSTVGGGDDNTASANYSTVSGGESNQASGDYSTVGGGKENLASGTQSTVAGGAANSADYRSTVSGGLSNTADSYGSVPGGYLNYATGFSFAAGRKAKANHQGSFVFADTNDFDFSTQVDNSFKVRVTGGVRFVVGIDGNGNTTWSCVLNYGNNWSCTSDRNMKENFRTVDSREILETLVEVPIQRWNAKGIDSGVDHMGPMAQDFYAAFSLGEDEHLIGTMDVNGVALAAIQGLYSISQEQAEQIEELQAENISLWKQINGGPTKIESHHLSVLVYILAGVVLLLLFGFIWMLVRFRRLLPSETSHVR